MPVIQKKDPKQTGDNIDVGLGMRLLCKELMENCPEAVDQSFLLWEWWAQRFIDTPSTVDIWHVVPSDGINPSLLELSVQGSSSLHPELLNLLPVEIEGVGNFDLPCMQIIIATACYLNPGLAEALVAHVHSLGPDAAPTPLPTSVLESLDLPPARQSMSVGTYLLKWPTGKITVGMTSVSFHNRLDQKDYYRDSFGLDERVGRRDYILFDVSNLSMELLGWGKIFAFGLETFAICVFNSTDPSIGRNRNKADRSNPKLCLPDSLWPNVWAKILELTARGIYMPRIRKAERYARLIDRGQFVRIPHTFAHFRTLYLQEVWPSSTGDFLLYTYLNCMVMLTHHGHYTRFPPLPPHAQTRHKGWRPPLPDQHLSAVMAKIARKLDRLEGKRIYGKTDTQYRDARGEGRSEEEDLDEDLTFDENELRAAGPGQRAMGDMESDEEEPAAGEAARGVAQEATSAEDVDMDSD